MKHIRFASFACLLLTASSTAATLPGDLNLSVEIESRLDSRGEMAEVAVSNLADAPQICDQLDISLSVIRTENDLPAGAIELRFTNIFVRSGETLTESSLGAAELRRLRASDPSARLFHVTSALGKCRKAVWADYCGYASLGTEEQKTMNLLKAAFGARECSDLRAEDVVKIRLPGAGIQDLRPFAYFPNLVVLHLGGNPIESIEPLLKLSKLEQVCLGHTPAASKSPLPIRFLRSCD